MKFPSDKINIVRIGLDWNALFDVDKIVEKKNQINECIIQVLAHINRYVSLKSTSKIIIIRRRRKINYISK